MKIKVNADGKGKPINPNKTVIPGPDGLYRNPAWVDFNRSNPELYCYLPDGSKVPEGEWQGIKGIRNVIQNEVAALDSTININDTSFTEAIYLIHLPTESAGSKDIAKDKGPVILLPHFDELSEDEQAKWFDGQDDCEHIRLNKAAKTIEEMAEEYAIEVGADMDDGILSDTKKDYIAGYKQSQSDSAERISELEKALNDIGQYITINQMAKNQKRISLEEYSQLLPGEKTKWEPVYSYIIGANGQGYEKYELLYYKPYINIPRREAE